MISPNDILIPNLGQIPDWANWVGLMATLIGLLISTVGLVATYKQAREAKVAARNAEEAAKYAINKLQNRNLLLGATVTSLQIQSIKEYINGDNFTAARSLFNVCSKTVRDVASHPIDSALDNRMDVIMKEVAAALDTATMSDSKKKTVLRKLREISERMATEETKRKWVE